MVEVVNLTPRRSKEVFKIVGGFAQPIYVLFFVLVGAKLNVVYLTTSTIILTLLYITGRSVGKILGARSGAILSHAPKTVQKYLPYCLFSQAGVAIGLSIVVSQTFPGAIGSNVVAIVTATTFVVQLIGPPCTKYAVTQAGEVGLDMTEEDVLSKLKVHDVMDPNPPLIYKSTPLMVILRTFSEFNYLNYPVIDENNKLVGMITVDNIRRLLADAEASNLILAFDIMEKIKVTISPEETAQNLKELFHKKHIDFMPVITKNQTIVGFVEEKIFEKEIATRMIQLQNKADSLDA